MLKLRQLHLILFMTLILVSGILVLPVIATGLPPRDDPPSNSTDKDTNDTDDTDDDEAPVGAYIELKVDLGLVGSWSHVEWQDSNGDWQSVDGWAGTVDDRGYRRSKQAASA
ncbi:MAG: hypothetical protein GY796_34820 [Chloroflexi bacterium]|nr:hypothetical protein [Chloroflexota bacterium]